MIRSVLKEVCYYLPSAIETNEYLHQQFPHWDMKQVEMRAGIKARHIAESDQTAFDLGLKACENLFQEHPDLKDSIDTLLFCTQSPDYIMPPNSALLHKALGLSESVFSMDFNLACSGFVYGLTIVDSLIQSGQSRNTLLVTADTYSKYIHPQDRSARTLFGDGAAVTWIQAHECESEEKKGIMKTQCGTKGAGNEAFRIPAGGCRQPSSEETRQLIVDKHGSARTLEHIHMDGMAVLGFVSTTVVKHLNSFLQDADITIDDIDLFVFHQASLLALNALSRSLNIPSEKMFINMEEIGNTVSSSIPIALKQAHQQGAVEQGQLILCCGFGVGLSWGSALIYF